MYKQLLFIFISTENQPHHLKALGGGVNQQLKLLHFTPATYVMIKYRYRKKFAMKEVTHFLIMHYISLA